MDSSLRDEQKGEEDIDVTILTSSVILQSQPSNESMTAAGADELDQFIQLESTDGRTLTPEASQRLITSLKLQLQMEREFTHSLIQRMEERLRADLLAESRQSRHNVSIAPPSNQPTTSSSSHHYVCHECAAKKKRWYRIYCCTGCLILFPLLIGAVGYLIYRNRHHIAWIQDAYAKVNTTQQRLMIKAQPMIEAKGRMQEGVANVKLKAQDVKDRSIAAATNLGIPIPTRVVGGDSHASSSSSTSSTVLTPPFITAATFTPPTGLVPPVPTATSATQPPTNTPNVDSTPSNR